MSAWKASHRSYAGVQMKLNRSAMYSALNRAEAGCCAVWKHAYGFC